MTPRRVWFIALVLVGAIAFAVAATWMSGYMWPDQVIEEKQP